MPDSTSTAWSFTNSRGRVITTHNAVDAEKYRNDPRFEEVTDAPSADPDNQDDDGHVLPYSDKSWTKEKLQDEIDARNAAAATADELIEVAEPGNKPQLIAALEADDTRRTEALAAASTAGTGEVPDNTGA